MNERPRLVSDTNVLVSRLLLRRSIAAQALSLAYRRFDVLRSQETLRELTQVIARPKFDRYRSLEKRLRSVQVLTRFAIHVADVPPLKACRDPKDDKFLALARAGKASVILTGDSDLLELHPFQEIAILSPRQFLDMYSDS